MVLLILVMSICTFMLILFFLTDLIVTGGCELA